MCRLSGYKAAVLASCPALRMLDNMGTRSQATAGSLAQVDGLQDKVAAAAEAEEEKSGCSCIYGNACVDPYNCLDWPNREKVAAKVRKERRLELEYISG